LAIGLLFAWWMSSAFAALLHGVDPHHPSAYVAAAILLLVSALLAAWLPARRAAATDPAVVLSAQ
jgi:ABC-type lipoprotein release transport system permease subunit